VQGSAKAKCIAIRAGVVGEAMVELPVIDPTPYASGAKRRQPSILLQHGTGGGAGGLWQNIMRLVALA
jgi:hypothetical protein